MKLSIYNIHYSWMARTTAVLLSLLFLNSVYAQVTKYERLHCVGRQSFNFIPSTSQHPYLHKNKDLLVVYSDRDGNKAYSNRFAQRVLGEQKMGSPYYVVDEKNGFCKLVAASPSIVGKPKGMLSLFYGSKRHLKDAASAPFVGWIPKDRLLPFGHAFVSPSNNLPIKFRVGTTAINRLFNLRPYCSIDSILVFKDPFFDNKTSKSVCWGQIVYAYKYDESKQAVLISDKPTLNDTERKVLGWVPSDMVVEVGQNSSCLLENERIGEFPLQSNFILFHNTNNKSKDNVTKLPVSVWDDERSYIINIKGGNFPVAEIKRMNNGSRRLNVHLLFFEKDRAEVRALASSLQDIAMKIPHTFQTSFSMTSISENGNQHLKCTPDYAQWLTFLEKTTSGHTNGTTSSVGFEAAINTIFNETPYVKFENDVFIVLGTDEIPTFTSDIKSKLAARSACLLFVQLYNKDNTSYQNFILQSKELLDANIAGYMNFITQYIADPKLDKPSLFKELSTDNENAYLLDVPQNSIATGGLVFPKANGRLSNPGLSNILDTLFVQISTKDSELITSLTKCKNKLGVQRAVPTKYVEELCKASSLSIKNLDRVSINETIYAKIQPNDSVLNDTTSGYLFNANELKTLFDGWRELMPYFTSGMGKKEVKILRKLYHRQCRSINDIYRRKVLSGKSLLSYLFYYKIGVPPIEERSRMMRIKDLTWKKCQLNGWDTSYHNMYQRLLRLEKLFKSNKLRTIEVSGVTYHFIPTQEML